jgi:CheY-like chemotaxis protein
MPIPGDDPRCVDSLRLSEQERLEIIAQLDRQARFGRGSERRQEERQHYEDGGGLVVRVQNPGGASVSYLVRARNLSTSGVGFLHGTFLYPGSSCTVRLTGTKGQPVEVAGKVARCQHVRGRVHEIGVLFRRPIRLGDYLRSRVAGPGDTTSALLPALRGRLLYIDESVDEQQLMRFVLDGMGVELHTATGAIEGLELAERTPFGAVIADAALPGLTLADLCQVIRASGYAGPVIAATADERPEAAKQALDAGCAHVLHKPYDVEALGALLSRYLASAPGKDADAEPLVSDKWSSVKMRPLILAFLSRLESVTTQLEHAASAGERAALEKLSLTLKGTAGGYGYPVISKSAQEVAALASAAPVEDLSRKVGELAAYCRAACRARPSPQDAG